MSFWESFMPRLGIGRDRVPRGIEDRLDHLAAMVVRWSVRLESAFMSQYDDLKASVDAMTAKNGELSTAVDAVAGAVGSGVSEISDLLAKLVAASNHPETDLSALKAAVDAAVSGAQANIDKLSGAAASAKGAVDASNAQFPDFQSSGNG